MPGTANATLGNYPNTTVQLSGNTSVIPDAAPSNTARINVSTSTNFKGRLEGNPVTGVVRVTDAHPAGIYTVTVTGFNNGGGTATATFTLTVTTPATCNPVTFAAAANFAVGTNPVSAAVGDFNGDGNQDQAIANRNSNSVSILLGNGAGSFDAAINFAVTSGPIQVALGDFNGDGAQDLVTANNSANVSVLLGNGTGGFGNATNFGGGSGPFFSVAVGDFNGDGKQDLAIGQGIANTASILLGDGAGGFGPMTDFPVGDGPFSVAVGDFNGDSNQDLAVANEGSNNVSVLLGNGAGSFNAANNFNVGGNPLSVAVGDFDGDGRQDLAVTNAKSDNVSVLLGNGAGSFTAATNFSTGIGPFSVAVGDFNGDGKQDIATANQISTDVSVLLGNGAGSFDSAANFGAGSVPSSVAVGDFNGDGKQDLATANQGSNNVSVLLRQCPAATLGNYPNTTVPLSGNTTVVPDAAPTNTVSINVSTSTSFKGRLEGNPATGLVRVTDAHPAGTYTVKVTGFASGGGTSTVTFTLTVTTPTTCNPVTFAPPANFNAGTSPVFAAVGDFNGDGNQDLAAANRFTNFVSVLLGNGMGSFSAATNFAVGGSGEPFAVAVGDFNGDGNQDLAVAIRTSTIISVLLGTGTGSFGAATSFTVGNEPLSLAVGDFNNDGRQDLAVANRFTNFVSVLLGDGMGSFSAATNFGAGSTPHAVAVGDFNGDGNQDLVVANYDTGTVSVLLGTGTGSFSAETTFAASGTNPRSLVIGDFNGDGNQDIAIPNSTVDNLSVLLGNGMGSFGSATNFQTGDFPISIRVGDFNGDGKQDLATANEKSNNVSVFLNITPTGSGTVNLGPRSDFGVGDSPFSLAVGDFNGDGKQDLATANQDSNDVSVLLRQCLAATPTTTPTVTPQPTPTPPTPTPTPPTPTPTPCIAIFSENFDSLTAPGLPGGWTTAFTGVEVPWVTSTTSPASAPNDAFAPDVSNKGNTHLIMPPIALPAGGGILTFQNLYNMQTGFDGMVLEISINGGAFADILAAGGSFAAGGYTHVISADFGNPIAGRLAWSGLSGGTTDAPAYITTTVNLPAAANGQNIQLKWRAATDNSAVAPGMAGVRIDNIVIAPASCGTPSTPTPPPTATPGVTPVPTATPGSSGTPTPGVTPTPGQTPTPTPSPPGGPTGVALVEVYDLNQSAGRLANISTRAFCGTGPNIVIAGFMLGSNASEDNVIVRGLGPSLAAVGVPSVLANPTLELRNSDGTLQLSNNDWQDSPSQAALITAAGLAPSNNLESAIAATLPPGLYTVLLAGLNNTTGNSLVEVYDLGGASGTPASQAVNLSTRMRVEIGDRVGIGGFIITGNTPKHVLLRAIGPSLTRFGITDVLADPVLELNGPAGFTTVINNNWKDTQRVAIQNTGLPPTDDLESAIDATLAPGAYTAIVRGNGPGGPPAPTPSPTSSPTLTPTVTPTPTPPGATPSPTPPGATPSPTPPGATPSPTPPGATPSPTPPGATPSPTPPGATPSPTPPGATPSPTPPAATPTPSPSGPCTENFDGVAAPALPAGWVATLVTGDPPTWETSTTAPDSAPNDAFAPDQDGISDKSLDSRNITINSASSVLNFRNNFNTEHDPPPAEVFWDGYVLEVSVAGGAFQDIIDAGGVFTAGPYTGEIDGTANNPLAGRMAWSGNSGGYIDTTINLPASFNGQTIRLRFRMGTDEAVAATGARVDGLFITSASCP
jgi:hypothetical protein